jgi:HK97 family phage portal protein
MASDKSGGGKTALVPRSRVDRGKPDEAPSTGKRVVHSGRSKSTTGEITVSGLLCVNNLDTKPHVTRPFEEDGWVHACAKAKGQAVGSVPAGVWFGEPGKDKKAELLKPNDPISRLFARPMPYMTSAQFFEASAHHRIMDGEDFWVLFGKDNKPLPAGMKFELPTFILPVRGSAVTPEVDTETGWPVRWHINRKNGSPLIVPVQSVIQFRDYNIDDPIRGLGDVEALYRDIDLAHQAYRYQAAILRNSGDPGGFITTETTLAPDEAEAAENEAGESFSVDNAGKWKVVSGKGVTFTPNKLGPKDMDFPKLNAWTRDKILGVLGVPPPFVGVLEFATLANFVESVRMFWQGGNGVLTYLKTVEDVITNLFLRNLTDPRAEKLYFRFDTSGIEALQADRNAQLEIAEKLAASNLGLSFEEACSIIGIDIEGEKLAFGKVHFMPSTLTTADRILEDSVNPPPDPAATPPPAGDKPAENPPANDSGKSVEVVAKEADAPPAVQELDPVEVARAARREYWSTKEARILRDGETALRKSYRDFRKEYERIVYARVRDFAAEGDAGLRVIEAVRRDGPNDNVPFDDLNPFSHDVDKLLPSRTQETARMARKFTDPIRGIWANALEDVATEIGAEFPMLPSDPSVLAALEQQVTQLVDGHIDYLAERVRSALLQELSKATNQANLQAAVDEVLPEITDELARVFGDRATRGNTIARTETARAANTARNMEMVHTGIATQEWITQHDAAVRGTPGGPYADSEFSHAELDGQSWAVGGLVDAGAHPHLKYPGDPEAEPGDTINCRCLARPVLQKDSTNQ